MNWQALVEALPEALLLVAASGKVRYLNSAACALLGYSAEQVIDQDVSMLLPADDRRRVDVVEWLARWGEQPAPLQWRYLHLTGRTSRGDPLRLAVRVGKHIDDGVVHYAITVRDVGEELREAALARHRHLVTTRLLALSEDGVVVADQRGMITYANPALTRLFGYRADELLGKPLDELLPPRARDAHRRHLAQFDRERSPSRLMGQRGVVLGLHRDGHVMQLVASITKASIEGERVYAAHVRKAGA